MKPSESRNRGPMVGIEYRQPIHDWTVANLERLDVLEVTINHFLVGGPRYRSAAVRLADQVPPIAHGVGLPLGSAVRPDPAYLDRVAGAIMTFGIPSYGEYIALTKLPLANLLCRFKITPGEKCSNGFSCNISEKTLIT